MPKFAVLFALILLSIPAVAWCDDSPATEPATQPTTNPAAVAEVKATIDEAIALIGKKDYGALLQRFIPPDDLKKIMDTPGEFDDLKTHFAGDKADDLSKALQECKAQEPTMLSDTEATYKISVRDRDFKLVKVDGKWYIAN